MASTNKNFSIAKLYSDLEKYQANLTGLKDSRLKRQGSGTSLHQKPSPNFQRPSSSQKYQQCRQSFGIGNLTRFQKNKLQVSQKSRLPRPTFDKYAENSRFVGFQKLAEQKSSYTNSNIQNSFQTSHQTSVLKQQTPQQNRQQRQFLNKIELDQKENKAPTIQFTKNQQLYFLNQCNKLYKIKSTSDGNQNRNGNEQRSNKDKALTAEEEAESVRILLSQINKRDRVYDAVIKRIGAQDVEVKLQEFFVAYDRMTKIIGEFKKMSKLNIDDDQQLYQFLISDEQEPVRKAEANEQNLMESEI